MSKRSDVFDEIAALAKERIMIIDGAMGTMIQREHLEEHDFRAEVSVVQLFSYSRRGSCKKVSQDCCNY
ncbi:unnamed protein product [Strongylus vulgaris]|uniref:Hcy-binding domain-containing protein n=1 Tax=Strongylus vulgaris TaxID=40348 RepID=A0A3P7JCK3_STRVU|nr:unnamed protein product [Strongylus vulgaris]